MRHATTAPRPHRAPLALALLGFLPACREDVPAPAGEAAADEARTAAAPRAWFEVDRERHDFGAVYHGVVRKTSFELVAAGSEPLVVSTLGRTCGCIEGELFVVDASGARSPVELEHPYAPGTRFELVATLNTLGRRGAQTQLVQLVTGGEHLTSLALGADIVSFLELDPPSLELPTVSALEGFEGELVVESRGAERFALDARRDVLPDDLELEFTPLEPDDDGRSPRWTMRYRIPPGVSRGAYRRKVLLRTDALNEEAAPSRDGSPVTHLGEVWIRTRVEGVFDLRPERLNFGTLTAGRTVEREVTLRSRDPGFERAELQVALVDRSGGPFPGRDAFEVDARRIDDGRSWILTIRAQDVPQDGPFQGSLRVQLGHPYEPELEIPFLGLAVAPTE